MAIQQSMDTDEVVLLDDDVEEIEEVEEEETPLTSNQFYFIPSFL